MAEPSPTTDRDDRCAATLLHEGRALRALARRLLRDSGSEDDVVQDAVLAAWQQRVAGERAGAWLQVVTRRLALLTRRRLGRRRAREEAAARGEALPSAFDAVAASETARDVSAAVAALDEPFRTAVVLRFWHGLPPRAIARRLGVPVNTVRSRIQRGLARLREQLDGRHGGERLGWAVPLAGIAYDGAGVALATTLGGVLLGTTGKVVGSVAAAALALWVLWAALAEPVVEVEREVRVGPAPGGSDADAAPQSVPVDLSPVGERAAVSPPALEQPVAAVLVGRLLDESDLAPLAQASIGWLDDPAQQARSGADGRFELPLHGVGERDYLSLWTEADGFARERRSCSLRELSGAPLRVDLGDLQMAPGTELTGRVVDAAGLPVAGAQLFLSQRGIVYSAAQMHGSDVLADAMPLAESDATGWFRSAHRVVPQGFEVFVIAAAPEGLGWTQVRPTRHAGRLDVQVALDQGAAPTVVVRDVDGQPIAGVTVEALPRFAPLGYEGIADTEGLASDQPRGARFVAQSDAEGLARFPLLPLGEGQNWGPRGAYRFRVMAEGYRERRLEVELQAGAAPLEVTLLRDRPFDVLVEVRAGEDGRPLKDAQVRVEARSATSDGEGRVRFEALRTEREELRYVVLAAGRVRASGTWAVPAAGELRVAVELDPAATLSGRVVDQHGQPVAGARVFVDGPMKTATDAEGRFAVEGLPLTPVSVVVHPPEPVGAWEPVPFAEPLPVAEQPTTFVLQRRVEGLATLALEVVDMATGWPVSPEPVWLSAVDERGLWAGGRWQPESISIGRARIGGVQPGRYELSVARLAKRIVVVGPDDRLVPLRIEVGQPGVIEGELVLAEGSDLLWPETVSVSVGPDTGAADWVAPGGGELVMQGEHRIVLAAKLTPARGTRFQLVDADPHRVISLTAQGGGLIGRASFRVPPGGVARPRLVLAPASLLRFRFTTPCPWQELEIQTRRPGGEWSLPLRYGWMGGRKELHVPLPAGPLEWRLCSLDPDSGESVVRGSGSVELIAGKGSDIDVRLGD